MPQKYDSLQAARVMGALIIVSYHFGAVELSYGAQRLVTPLLAYGDVVIDMFFVISGFLMATLYRAAPPGVAAVNEYVLRRISRIYPAYWLISLLVLGAWMLSGRRVFDVIVGPRPDMLANFLLIPGHTRPVLGVAWTLLHEIYFYAGFAVLLLLPIRLRPWGAGAWALATLAGYALLRRPELHSGLALVSSPYTLEFVAGLVLGWWGRRLHGVFAGAALGLAALIVCLGMILTGFDHDRIEAMSALQRLGIEGSAALLAVYGLVGADMRSLWRCPPPLTATADWSYSLYLVHTPIIAMVCFGWRPFSRPGLWDNGVAYLAALTASLAAACLIWTLFERPWIAFGAQLARKMAPPRPIADGLLTAKS